MSRGAALSHTDKQTEAFDSIQNIMFPRLYSQPEDLVPLVVNTPSFQSVHEEVWM